jgi:hypothetical protein
MHGLMTIPIRKSTVQDFIFFFIISYYHSSDDIDPCFDQLLYWSTIKQGYFVMKL